MTGSGYPDQYIQEPDQSAYDRRCKHLRNWFRGLLSTRSSEPASTITSVAEFNESFGGLDARCEACYGTPLKLAEFVILKIQQKAGKVSA